MSPENLKDEFISRRQRKPLFENAESRPRIRSHEPRTIEPRKIRVISENQLDKGEDFNQKSHEFEIELISLQQKQDFHSILSVQQQRQSVISSPQSKIASDVIIDVEAQELEVVEDQ